MLCTVATGAAKIRAGGSPTRDRKLRAQGRRTLQRILDAGLSVFADRGYQAARVDDIAGAAGVSHGTFYLYFANKEELFEALAADVVEEMKTLAAGMGRIGPDASGYEALHEWLDRFAALYAHHAPVIRVWQSAESDPEMLRFGRTALAEVVEVLSNRIEETGNPAGLDSGVAAVAFVSLIERFNYLVAVRQLNVRRETMLDTLAAVLHRGVFGGDGDGTDITIREGST